MEELCEEICQLFESGQIYPKKVSDLMEELVKVLSKATSRFVDIDSTVKEDSVLVQYVKENLSASFPDDIQKNNLYAIYEVLKTYLGLKVKYGEAADWFLKNEFETYLHAEINKALGRALLR